MKLQREQIIEAIKLVNGGMNLREVAKLFGVSYETIRQHYLKQIGLPLNSLRTLQTIERREAKRKQWLRTGFNCKDCNTRVTKRIRPHAQKYCQDCARVRIANRRIYSIDKRCVICQTLFHPHSSDPKSLLCSRTCQIKWLIFNNRKRKGAHFSQAVRNKISRGNKRAWRRRREAQRERVRAQVTRAFP